MGMPPWVESLIFGGVGGALFMKNVGQGAATECYVAVNPKVAGVTGEYFADSNIKAPRADAKDPALAAKLWEVSEKIVAGLPA
jgi:hypothetical protein